MFKERKFRNPAYVILNLNTIKSVNDIQITTQLFLGMNFERCLGMGEDYYLHFCIFHFSWRGISCGNTLILNE